MSGKKPIAKRKSRWPRRFRWSSRRFSPEQLAWVAAMFLASSVMALGFYRRVREMEVLFRAAIVFAVTWVVVFVAISIIKHIVLHELERRKRDEAAVEEQAAESKNNETDADDSYEQLGGT